MLLMFVLLLVDIIIISSFFVDYIGLQVIFKPIIFS